MKYKIKGIVTIPAGLAQEEELKIDSPEIEIISGYQSRNENTGEVDVTLDIRYTFMQGSEENKRRINRVFPWDALSDEQKTIIGEMVIESRKLMLSIPDHSGATPV